MRVFMLVQSPAAHTPVPKHTAELITALGSLGCDVVTHIWGRRAEGESMPKRVFQRVRDVQSVRRALRNRDFDVAVVKTAHDWQTVLRDLTLTRAIRGRTRAIVLQLHGSDPSALHEPGRRAFKLASAVLLSAVDAILVLSTEEQSLWRAFRREPPVFVVKNPYARGRFQTRNDSTSEKKRILFVGRLIAEKGIFDLAEAFAHVVKEVDCELVIAGEGVEADKLERTIEALGLEDRIRFPGYISGAGLREEYANATVFVLPTRWKEGFPTVIAEAMDAGLPIITTAIRGTADHLVDGENALFVEPGDVGSLATAITSVLRDEDLRRRMSAANVARIRMFDPKIVAAEYLQVLKSVTGPKTNLHVDA
jgi:glycosyltransferase involved in cell wall biosynthesis